MPNLGPVVANSVPRFADERLGDQKTTLQAAQAAVGIFNNFGVYPTILFNPTFPAGSEYEPITSENQKQFAKGEHIFLLIVGSHMQNVDSVLQILEDKRTPDMVKVERLMEQFGIYNWRNLPKVQSAYNAAISAILNS